MITRRFHRLFHAALPLLAGAVAMVALGGCQPGIPKPTGYYGPTMTLHDVVAGINQNNQKLPTLWSTIYFEANLIDKDKKSHFVNGDGVLLDRKPSEMRLIGTKPGTTLFEIGSTEERYWLILLPEADTMWWGHYANLGKPCSEQIPLRPDLVMEVLGIADHPANLLQAPAPSMRFNNDADAYMLVWTQPRGDHQVAVKEVWYDRQTLRPIMVLLFDDNGRVVLRAYLSKHEKIRVPNLPEDQWPVVATQFDLFFPDSLSTLKLTLKNPKLNQNNIPHAGSIRFPENPGVSNTIQIDADCKD